MNTKTALIVAALGLTLGLSACETATPYQPLSKDSKVSGGYSEQKLDAEHFKINFKGNDLTSRATVEQYLLFRAAEITLAQGYDWFETVDQHTDRKTESWVESDPFYGPSYRWGYFRPYWSFYGPRYGWRHFGPWGGMGPWPGEDVIQTSEQFEAGAVIALHHGPKPADNPRALDAREVQTNLATKIQRPKP